MLGHFPKNRPDESLYSLACEYKRRLQIASNKGVSKDLFGVDYVHDMVDLPSHVRHLESQIPKEFEMGADYIIQHTTALPYFSPFLKPDLLRAAIGAIKGTIREARSFFHGMRAGASRTPNQLRICLECAATDRKESGSTYWRRAPQLPAVQVCRIHRRLLTPSGVSRGWMVASRYIHADEAVDDLKLDIKAQRASSQVEPILLWLSEQSEFLLSNPIECISSEKVRGFYLNCLYEAGLASVGGTVQINRLATLISKRYTRAGLSRALQVNLTAEHVEYWLWRVLVGRASPLQHLVLMHFLDISVAELVRGSKSTQFWFEPGPWPCLNPTCISFEADVIQDLQAYVLHGKLRARFACYCGYAYERIGPDKDGDSRKTPTRSIDNAAWDEALRRLWLGSSLNVTEIKVKLQTSYNRMERALLRLGLDPCEKKRSGGGVWPSKVKPLSQSDLALRAKHRAVLCEWLDKNPNATRSDLYLYRSTSIRWLWRKDREWASQKVPDAIGRKRSESHSDARSKLEVAKLLAKDKAVASLVQLTSKKLHSIQSPLRRVSAARILVRMGFTTGLGNSKSRMVLTRAALDRYSESVAQFAVRRIRNATKTLAKSEGSVTFTRLLQVTGLRGSHASAKLNAAVVCALSAARRQLGI